MNRRLQDWVDLQAQRRPEAPAIVFRSRTVTYGELETRTNQVARALLDAGCEPGDRVGLLVPKSVEAILGILGTLKAGCLYVPMDTSSPAPRLRAIQDACRSRAVLVAGSGVARWDEIAAAGDYSSVRVGCMEPRNKDLRPAAEPVFMIDDLDSVDGSGFCTIQRPEIAHILFTSGSTGIPKGVPILHESVIRFVEWATRYFGHTENDRISGHPPLHFDLSTFDIFGALSVGAALYPVPAEISLLPHKIAGFIRESHLTQWFSVPSVLTYMAKFDVVRQDDFPSLRRLLWCGERFPTPGLIYWMTRLPSVRFTNLYGPTEATIASSYYTVPVCPSDSTREIPIGAACEGEELLVLDDRLQPVQPGEIGDLYIGGVGLSPGYWGDEQKTAAAFPPHPSGRIYKTGDLASIREDGLIYLHGRADSQIKSRGYRIELGEIETALATFGELRESAVVAVDAGGFEGLSICCAYVPADGCEVAGADLKARLAKLIPPYMIPAQWLQLQSLPLNANGKVDRPKLREHFRPPLARAAATPAPRS